MEKKKIIKVLQQEINWHKENYKKNVINKDKKDGFILGLKQAILIIKKI